MRARFPLSLVQHTHTHTRTHTFSLSLSLSHAHTHFNVINELSETACSVPTFDDGDLDGIASAKLKILKTCNAAALVTVHNTDKTWRCQLMAFAVC